MLFILYEVNWEVREVFFVLWKRDYVIMGDRLDYIIGIFLEMFLNYELLLNIYIFLNCVGCF